ncbi:hypothetical protein B0H65DRAFT_182359 [Neurospora tetraspora]|uniref:Uncharacterized protein n=1 Tax=Neurospora tetraspora TaxID=94610 RepID=A0AAE0JE51_9PEZI|nr:hypothetical protein B0H65DRAFT_182359 [Neurospora tetraspora]
MFDTFHVPLSRLLVLFQPTPKTNINTRYETPERKPTSQNRFDMGIFCRLRPRRHRHLPREQTMPAPLPLYEDDALDKQHHNLSTPNSDPQEPKQQPRSGTVLSSTSPSPSTPSSISTATLNARFATCLDQLDQLFGRHSSPPTRRPPSRLPTSETAPPPPYAPLSSYTDLPLPSYSELQDLGRVVFPPRPTPREPPPSFEAAEIQEHEEDHGTEPFLWPGCEYCRVYALWVCYWRGVGEVRG